METQEQLQGRLHSLEELRTIVKTMKALSAASIRQYEQAVDAVSGYYQTVEQGLQVVMSDMPRSTPHEPPAQRAGAVAAIVCGSDHGLCGRFNEEIADYTLAQLPAGNDGSGRTRLLTVGGRVAAALEHEGRQVDRNLLVPGAAEQITRTVQRILVQLDTWQADAGVIRVRLFYNRHAERKSYQPTGMDLLPVDRERFQGLREKPWPSRSLPTFSMHRPVLLQRLVRQYLFVSLFRACAESQASEHASRLAAMQSAERNLDERLDEVTMTYRRARQNAITSELLDVVSGFEAITTARA